MATDILMRRRGFSYVAADDLAEDQMLTMPDMAMVTVRKPRSIPMHRFYFGIIGQMIKAGAPGNTDGIHNATKIKTGLVTFANLPNGEFMAFPDSTAFDRMDQAAFNVWFPKAIAFWTECGLWDFVSPDIKAKIETGERQAA